MIITDSEPAPKSPDKSTTPLLGGAGGSGAPPPYAPSGSAQAGPTPIGPPHVVYGHYQAAYTTPRGGQHGSACRRFTLAFLMALGIWVLLSTLLGSIVVDGGGRNFGFSDYPIPSGVQLESCETDWLRGDGQRLGSFPYSAQTSFKFSLPSEALLLLSQGSLSQGELKITTSPEVQDVQVHISVHYYTAAVRNSAKVCLIKRKNGERGVGIFTPRYWRRPAITDKLHFRVQLVLPRGTSLPGYINRLLTDVSNFSQDVDALQTLINFDKVSLKGSNGLIHVATLGAKQAELTTSNAQIVVESLVAAVGNIVASNGGISGTFSTSESLVLRTSNGPIQVVVGVDGGDKQARKTVQMRTSNNIIDAALMLATPSGKGGNFDIETTTTNGRLKTQVMSLPLDAVLALSATTSNSHGHVVLHNAYEGAFSISTSNNVPAVVRQNRNEDDPAGKGRTRTVAVTTHKNRVRDGNVYWDYKNRNRGKVTLKTSNAPVSLYL